MRRRREPRDLALERLYEAELQGSGAAADDLPAKAARLVEGVTSHLDELDEAINRASVRWNVRRMPAVDRTILRMGLYELRYTPDMPVGVVLSEAVRMAKTYSTAQSGKFVNGVLGELARRERPETD